MVCCTLSRRWRVNSRRGTSIFSWRSPCGGGRSSCQGRPSEQRECLRSPWPPLSASLSAHGSSVSRHPKRSCSEARSTWSRSPWPSRASPCWPPRLATVVPCRSSWARRSWSCRSSSTPWPPLPRPPSGWRSSAYSTTTQEVTASVAPSMRATWSSAWVSGRPRSWPPYWPLTGRTSYDVERRDWLAEWRWLSAWRSNWARVDSMLKTNLVAALAVAGIAGMGAMVNEGTHGEIAEMMGFGHHHMADYGGYHCASHMGENGNEHFQHMHEDHDRSEERRVGK